MNNRYRCLGCRKRFSTKHELHIEKIRNSIRHVCSKCGCTKVYRIKNENVCRCDGYHFPHREGSLWCAYSTIELKEEDYMARHLH